MPPHVTEEEIQAELDEMKRSGRNHTPRSVRGSFFTPQRLRVMVITVLIIAILLCAFVWISNLRTDTEKDGYIININDLYESEGQGGLVLAFDPTFNEEYKSLIGLGYGDVDSIRGGSMLELLGTDLTMFAKFQDFALNGEMASQYEGNAGQANFDEYYCNKYYLKNTGTQTIKFRLNLKVTQNINGALHAARFMIVEGNSVSGYDYQIFATPNKETGEKEVAAVREQRGSSGVTYEYFTNPHIIGDNVTTNKQEAWLCNKLEVNSNTGFYQYTSCDVDQDGKLVSGEYYEIQPGETVCYTICVWFEGSDPDHNNDIIGGGISFSVDYETEDYVIYLCEREKELLNA